MSSNLLILSMREYRLYWAAHLSDLVCILVVESLRLGDLGLAQQLEVLTSMNLLIKVDRKKLSSSAIMTNNDNPMHIFLDGFFSLQ